jgi:hypothetical protein
MLFGDLIAGILCAGLALFFLFPGTRLLYDQAYSAAPVLVSFLKFAFLATGGEWFAKRIRDHSYSIKGFGLLPKALIWGILGIFIYWAFQIFGSGVSAAFPFIKNPAGFGMKLLGAFLTSLMMNLIFSPVLMLTHHLTDKYIVLNQGRFPLRKTTVQPLFEAIDWNRMWGFVFVKTIPFFWIPAHTITFLLPAQYRPLFAAMLSVVLGILLGIGSKKK